MVTGLGVLSCVCFSPQLGKQKKKYMPYNHQHKYFFLSECPHSAPGDSLGGGGGGGLKGCGEERTLEGSWYFR